MTHLTQAIVAVGVLVLIVIVMAGIIWTSLNRLREDVVALALEILNDEIEQAKALHPASFEAKS